MLSDVSYEVASLQIQLLHVSHAIVGEVSRQKISLVLAYRGLQRFEVSEAQVGDIVALTGIANANIGGRRLLILIIPIHFPLLQSLSQR